jgi:hypothetical protein
VLAAHGARTAVHAQTTSGLLVAPGDVVIGRAPDGIVGLIVVSGGRIAVNRGKLF